eukprot:TRINITY_DN63536_c0_g1_i1.p1 TRINITY_DN63536_c0_g1~~TRINITY_DN63536_c0_g1_i1.p1  ORF type:complete len:503 (+),score=99.26 TRINITY_DN63536_c0_g1_i1:65-1573(+)
MVAEEQQGAEKRRRLADETASPPESSEGPADCDGGVEARLTLLLDWLDRNDSSLASHLEMRADTATGAMKVCVKDPLEEEDVTEPEICARTAAALEHYRDYIRSLPAIFDDPLHWTEGELEHLLSPSNLYHQVRDKKRELSSHFEAVRQHLLQRSSSSSCSDVGEVAVNARGLPRQVFEQMQFEDWLWARSVWTSRSFSARLKVGANVPLFLPLIDVFNHLNEYPVSVCREKVVDEEHEEQEYHNVVLAFTDSVSITPGEEVWNNYGDKGNEELLLAYGFTISDNPFDSVLWPLEFEKSQISVSLDAVRSRVLALMDSCGKWWSAGDIEVDETADCVKLGFFLGEHGNHCSNGALCQTLQELVVAAFDPAQEHTPRLMGIVPAQLLLVNILLWKLKTPAGDDSRGGHYLRKIVSKSLKSLCSLLEVSDNQLEAPLQRGLQTRRQCFRTARALDYLRGQRRVLRQAVNVVRKVLEALDEDPGSVLPEDSQPCQTLLKIIGAAS